MQDERWKFLCEEASTEQDPVRLGELIKEINDLIQKKQVRLKANEPQDTKQEATHSTLPQSENALADEA